MKIVCENCSTKYSIADEKVRGKVFKIRCKKCGHIIVVKGTGMAAADAPAPAEAGAGQFDDKETRVFDYSGFAENMATQAVWHLVIDGGQVGPLSPEQVGAKYEAGEIDADTYIWKEGFKDWLRLADCDEFAGLVTEGEAPTEVVSGQAAAQMFSNMAAAGSKTPAPEPRQDPEPAPSGGGLFGGAAAAAPMQQKKSDLFGGLPPEPEPAAPAASAGAGDLFGSTPAASPAGGGGLFASPAAEPAGASSKGSLFPEEEEEASGSPAMTGQRNENSVLFSLSNLQSLASGGGGPSAPSASSSSSGSAKPGYASAKGGGSGLVDIRAMAATTLPKGGSRDDAMGGFSFSSPSLAAPISSAPVLMPVADDRPKWMLPAIFGGIGLLVAVVVLLVIVLMGKKDDGKKTEKQAAGPAAGMTNDMGSGGSSTPNKGFEFVGDPELSYKGKYSLSATYDLPAKALGSKASCYKKDCETLCSKQKVKNDAGKTWFKLICQVKAGDASFQATFDYDKGNCKTKDGDIDCKRGSGSDKGTVYAKFAGKKAEKTVAVAVAPMDTGMTPEAMSTGSASSSSSSSASAGASKRRRRRRGSSSSTMHVTSSSHSAMRVTSSSSSSMGSSSSSMGSSSLQDLLRRAGSSMSDSSSMSAADANLPQRLSPGKIRSGVGRVIGSARACYNRYRVAGTCRVRVVIKGSTGRVGSASVLGSFSGTPTGRCVARAFRRAKFSRFKATSQSFVFPMIFR